MTMYHMQATKGILYSEKMGLEDWETTEQLIVWVENYWPTGLPAWARAGTIYWDHGVFTLEIDKWPLEDFNLFGKGS